MSRKSPESSQAPQQPHWLARVGLAALITASSGVACKASGENTVNAGSNHTYAKAEIMPNGPQFAGIQLANMRSNSGRFVVDAVENDPGAFLDCAIQLNPGNDTDGNPVVEVGGLSESTWDALAEPGEDDGEFLEGATFTVHWGADDNKNDGELSVEGNVHIASIDTNGDNKGDTIRYYQTIGVEKNTTTVGRSGEDFELLGPTTAACEYILSEQIKANSKPKAENSK